MGRDRSPVNAARTRKRHTHPPAKWHLTARAGLTGAPRWGILLAVAGTWPAGCRSSALLGSGEGGCVPLWLHWIRARIGRRRTGQVPHAGTRPVRLHCDDTRSGFLARSSVASLAPGWSWKRDCRSNSDPWSLALATLGAVLILTAGRAVKRLTARKRRNSPPLRLAGATIDPTAPPPASFRVVKDRLIVRGARQHNLKQLRCRDSATNLHGHRNCSFLSRKVRVSPPAASTPRARRRYVESLSAYARQFLERMEKPDVDRGRRPIPRPLPSSRRIPRKLRAPTVGTATEIYDYLRLLWMSNWPHILPAVRPGPAARTPSSR